MTALLVKRKGWRNKIGDVVDSNGHKYEVKGVYEYWECLESAQN